MSEQNGTKYLTQTLFFWIIGGLCAAVIMFGSFLWNRYAVLDTRVDTFKDELFKEVRDVKQDVTGIKSDVGWIKSLLSNSEITCEE